MIIAFEGIDGSGKTTQISLLKDKFQKDFFGKIYLNTISFPQYNKTFFSKDIVKYLNGKFGTLDEVDPHFAALLYAGDRLESKHLLKQIPDLWSSKEIILIDRYIASNLAHQGSIIKASEQDQFISWLSDIEYGAYGLPQADLTILIDMPAELAYQRILQKTKRDYTDKKTDLHESNIEHLNKCRELYLQLADKNFKSKWTLIDASRECISEIQNKIAKILYKEIKNNIWIQ